MDFEMHHRRQNQKSIGSQDTVNLIDRPLRIRNVLKGFEVKHQSDALIGNRFHGRNVTENIDAGRIEILHVLFDIPLPRKKGLIVIWLPSGAGIEDGLLKGELFDGPFNIFNDCFSHLSPFLQDS